MTKFKSVIVACLLILVSAIFVACGQPQIENLSFKEKDLYLCVGDRVELQFDYSPSNVELKVEYSISDSSVAYVLPNSNILVALKEGSAVVYAKTENGKTASLNVQVFANKQKLSTPSNLQIDRANNKLTWIGVPATFQYEIEITFNDRTITKTTPNNYLDLSEVEGLNLEPGNRVDFRVRALASSFSTAYQNSDFTEVLTYNELYAITNLQYNLESGEISFEYDVNNQVIDNKEVYFQINVTGAETKTFRILKNDEGRYYETFIPTEAGEYTISVIALMSGKNSSVPEVIKLNKLEEVTLQQVGQSILSEWQENESNYKINLTIEIAGKTPSSFASENQSLNVSNIDISNGEVATIKSYVEKINNEEIVDNIKTYYLSSNTVKINLEKIKTPSNLEILKVNDNSIKLIWLDEGNTYKVYQNGSLIDCEQNKVINGSNKYVEVVVDNLTNAGEYNFEVCACKEKDATSFYLDSDNAAFKKVIKFAQANLQFNSETSRIEYSVEEIQIDGNIAIKIKNDTTTNISEKIVATEGYVDITITKVGAYSVEVGISKSEDENLYLSSDAQTISITKLSPVDYEKQILSNNSEILITFAKKANASSYKIYINNEELSETIDPSKIYRTRIDDVTINNKEYGQFTLKNINVAGKYVLNIIAVGSDNTTENVYVITSNSGEYEFNKLASPTVNYTKVDSKIVTFNWNAVSGENVSYEIQAVNVATGETMTSAPTYGTTTNLTFASAGEYSVTINAKSSKTNYLKSNTVDNTNRIFILKLNVPEDLTHEIQADGTTNNSIFKLNKVANANGYYVVLEKVNGSTSVEICNSNSFEIQGDSIIFNLGNLTSLFDAAGQYVYKVYATSSEANVLNSEIASYTINKLCAPENIAIEYNQDSTMLRFTVADSNTRFKISIDGGEFVEFTGNSYDISTLNAGSHEFKIYSVGNGKNILDSNTTSQVERVLIRLSTPTNINLAVNEEDDSKVVLSFNKVENAAYYEIIIKQSSERTIIFNPSLVQETYNVEFLRSDFNVGLQSISVIAKPADDSEQYEASFASEEIFIEKSSDIQNLTLNNDEKLVLFEKQALISGNLYTNCLLDAPSLSSGERITFVVRNVSTIIDDFDAQKKFYLAGDWKEVSLTKLTTPTTSISEGLVNVNYVSEGVDYNLILQLDYYGLNNSGEALNRFTFNLTTILGELSSFNLKDFINNNVTLSNLVGDYKFAISARPTGSEDLDLYLTSNSSSELNYRYIENIENSNAVYYQENDGTIGLTINKNYLQKINKLYFEITQNSNKCRFEINLADNSINVLENNLNSVALSLNLINLANENKYEINIYKLINSSNATISWTLKGDEKYYISPTSSEVQSVTKLAKPEFTYSSDTNGNKLSMTSATINAMPNATFVARYNSLEIEFSKTSEGAFLYLPYEWTMLGNIQILALTTDDGFINSDEVIVDFERAESVSNLHLTEDDVNDKTFVEWTSTANEFIVYLSQDNFTTQKNYTTTQNKLQITDEMLSVGNLKIRVVVKGYLDGSNIYLNSEFVELTCQKLDNQLNVTNPLGVLVWNTYTQENLLKQYRIKIGETIYNFAPSVHTFDVKDHFGFMTLQIKLVGDPEQNIISSDYQEVLVYKFDKPSSFKIQDGKFVIDEDISSLNVSASDVDFMINVNSTCFLYSSYVAYDEEMLERFYQILGTSSGTANANFIVKTNTFVTKDDKKYLALNSDKTDDKVYGVYQIDIENDKFYLTQTQIEDEILTYFNWEWVDETFASEGSVRIIIKPHSESFLGEITTNGWNTIIDRYLNTAAYYIDVDFNNKIVDGNYVSSYLCIKLPQELQSGSYTIQVQKTSISSGANLSSQNVDVLNFTKLITPTTNIESGKIVWDADALASYFQMLHSNIVTPEVLNWSEKLFGTSYEPNSLYENLTGADLYKFKFFAFGNVTELKPTENLSALSKDYVIVSDAYEGQFIKLRRPGNLLLSNGVLYWDETDDYSYYSMEGKESKIEIKFYNLSMEELTSVVVPATLLVNDGNIKFIDTYLNDAQKNILKNSGKVIIQYRQLGGVYINFINSEYTDLKIDSAQSTIIDGVERNYFEFLNRTLDINISEENGLTFTGITYDTGLISKVYYDVYFKLGKGDTAEIILATTLDNKTNITFAELKDLIKAKDPDATISEIFVVARGNDTYYLSSLQSAIKYVYTITGEATMYIESGIIKWLNIENAGSYVIRSIIGDETYDYVIRYSGGKFYVNNVETNAVYFDKNDNKIWCFNIAAYDGIETDIEHNLYIRYMPLNQGTNVFAFPGEWTANAIRVYKISKPNVSLSQGIFVWDEITNAIEYRIILENAEGTKFELTQTTTNFVLDLEEIANKFNTNINEVIANISSYKISFQSVGTNASVNGVYFISSVAVVKTGLSLKANTISNITIDQDTLSWEDSVEGNEYIIYITGVDNGVNILKTITTAEKTYNLAEAKLNGDNDASYSVIIKVAGDDTYLASAESVNIDFKVLHSIDEISLDNGLINFTVQEGATSYTLTFVVASYTYNYTITKVGDNYVVERVERVSGSTVNVLTKEENVEFRDGKIYLWPANVSMNQSATVSVKANGYEKDGVTYISSYAKVYGTAIFKPDISKISKGKISYDSATDTTTITWTTGLTFKFNVDIKLYKFENGVRTEIAAQSFTNTTLKLNSKLDAGTYELSIQIIPLETNYYLKSEWKTLTYTYNG